MNIVPKLHTNNTFFLFSDGGREIQFLIDDKRVKPEQDITMKERIFIENQFGIHRKRKVQKANTVVRLKNKGLTYAEVAKKTGLSADWCRQLYITYS